MHACMQACCFLIGIVTVLNELIITTAFFAQLLALFFFQKGEA